MIEKLCNRCGQAKHVSDFYKNKLTCDGYANPCKDCKRSYQQAHRAEQIDHYREYDRQRGFRNYDPVKTKARRKVNHEIASGRLERKPCMHCGSLKSEAHHHDYSKPLDVVWLCRTHHAEEHRS